MILSSHFTLKQFTFSQTAIRHGIENAPSEAEIVKLRALAVRLEDVWDCVGGLSVSSAFRCVALNRVLLSKDTSQHIKCEAADCLSTNGLSAFEMCQRVARSSIAFDQLIFEFDSWMHVSFRLDAIVPRHSIITIRKEGTFPGIVP